MGDISQNQRLDLIDLYRNNLPAHTATAMGDTLRLITLQPTYMHLRTSKASTIEMKIIGSGKRSLYVVINTIESPTAHSHIDIYNSQWEKLDPDKYLTLPTVATFFNNNTPPTDEQLSQVKLPFIQYTMRDDNNNIIATATFISTLDIELQRTFEQQCSRNLILKWKGKKWREPQPTTLIQEQQQ